VLLLGEIDLDREDDVPAGFAQGEQNEVLRRCKEEKGENERRQKRKVRRLRGEGFVGEEGEVVL
jgi:hypothetical protein